MQADEARRGAGVGGDLACTRARRPAAWRPASSRTRPWGGSPSRAAARRRRPGRGGGRRTAERGQRRWSVYGASYGAELLEGDGLLDRVVLAAEQLADDVRVAVGAHAEVGGGDAVGVDAGVLQEDAAAGDVDGCSCGPTSKRPWPSQRSRSRDRREELRLGVPVAGGQDQALGGRGSKSALLLLLAQPERVACRSAASYAAPVSAELVSSRVGTGPRRGSCW